jgi:hypothetical protein
MVATIDWPAVGAVATGIAATATAGLAYATWRMAGATRDIANSSGEQLAELRRHANAAEATVQQGKRTLEATTSPRLRVLRTSGQEAAVATGDGDWSVMIYNSGAVSATIVEARLDLSPQPIFLEPQPGGDVASEGQCLLRAEVSPNLLEQMLGGLPLPLMVQYEGSGAEPIYTRATLRAKDGGDRWLVIDREKDKSHGGGVASW